MSSRSLKIDLDPGNVNSPLRRSARIQSTTNTTETTEKRISPPVEARSTTVTTNTRTKRSSSQKPEDKPVPSVVPRKRTGSASSEHGIDHEKSPERSEEKPLVSTTPGRTRKRSTSISSYKSDNSITNSPSRRVRKLSETENTNDDRKSKKPISISTRTLRTRKSSTDEEVDSGVTLRKLRSRSASLETNNTPTDANQDKIAKTDNNSRASTKDSSKSILEKHANVKNKSTLNLSIINEKSFDENSPPSPQKSLNGSNNSNSTEIDMGKKKEESEVVQQNIESSPVTVEGSKITNVEEDHKTNSPKVAALANLDEKKDSETLKESSKNKSSTELDSEIVEKRSAVASKCFSSESSGSTSTVSKESEITKSTLRIPMVHSHLDLNSDIALILSDSSDENNENVHSTEKVKSLTSVKKSSKLEKPKADFNIFKRKTVYPKLTSVDSTVVDPNLSDETEESLIINDIFFDETKNEKENISESRGDEKELNETVVFADKSIDKDKSLQNNEGDEIIQGEIIDTTNVTEIDCTLMFDATNEKDNTDAIIAKNDDLLVVENIADETNSPSENMHKINEDKCVEVEEVIQKHKTEEVENQMIFTEQNDQNISKANASENNSSIRYEKSNNNKEKDKYSKIEDIDKQQTETGAQHKYSSTEEKNKTDSEASKVSTTNDNSDVSVLPDKRNAVKSLINNSPCKGSESKNESISMNEENLKTPSPSHKKKSLNSKSASPASPNTSENQLKLENSPHVITRSMQKKLSTSPITLQMSSDSSPIKTTNSSDELENLEKTEIETDVEKTSDNSKHITSRRLHNQTAKELQDTIKELNKLSTKTSVKKLKLTSLTETENSFKKTNESEVTSEQQEPLKKLNDTPIKSKTLQKKSVEEIVKPENSNELQSKLTEEPSDTEHPISNIKQRKLHDSPMRRKTPTKESLKVLHSTSKNEEIENFQLSTTEEAPKAKRFKKTNESEVSSEQEPLKKLKDTPIKSKTAQRKSAEKIVKLQDRPMRRKTPSKESLKLLPSSPNNEEIENPQSITTEEATNKQLITQRKQEESMDCQELPDTSVTQMKEASDSPIKLKNLTVAIERSVTKIESKSDQSTHLTTPIEQKRQKKVNKVIIKAVEGNSPIQFETSLSGLDTSVKHRKISNKASPGKIHTATVVETSSNNQSKSESSGQNESENNKKSSSNRAKPSKFSNSNDFENSSNTEESTPSENELQASDTENIQDSPKSLEKLPPESPSDNNDTVLGASHMPKLSTGSKNTNTTQSSITHDKSTSTDLDQSESWMYDMPCRIYIMSSDTEDEYNTFPLKKRKKQKSPKKRKPCNDNVENMDVDETQAISPVKEDLKRQAAISDTPSSTKKRKSANSSLNKSQTRRQLQLEGGKPKLKSDRTNSDEDHGVSVMSSSDKAENNEEWDLSSKSFFDFEAEESSEGTPSTDSNEIVEVGESIGSNDSFSLDEDDYEENSFICDDDSADDIDAFTPVYTFEEPESSAGEGPCSKKQKFNRIQTLRDSTDDQSEDDDNSDSSEHDNESTVSAEYSNEKTQSSSQANISPVCQVKVKSKLTNGKKLKNIVDTSVGYPDPTKSIRKETGARVVSVSTFSKTDYQDNKVIISKNILEDIEEGLKCKLYEEPFEILKPASSLSIIDKLPVNTSLYSKLSKQIMEQYVQPFCSKINDGELCVNISLNHTKKPLKTGKRKTEKDIVYEYPLDERPLSFTAKLKERIAKRKFQIKKIKSPEKKQKYSDQKEYKTEKRLTSQGKSCRVTSFSILPFMKNPLENIKEKPELINYPFISDTSNKTDSPVLKLKSKKLKKKQLKGNLSEDIEQIQMISSEKKDKKKKVRKSPVVNEVKLHPKDFKNEMLMNSKKAKRIETKELLKKKGINKYS